MHPTAMQNANKFLQKYLTKNGLFDCSILDVGGANVNGGLRTLFTSKGHTFQTLDIRDADGVDIVAIPREPYPINDGEFDVIVSSSMMEHDEAFWLTFDQMVRVCKSGGYIYICTPSRGNHHWDRDCWRFLADAYPALAKSNGNVELLEYYIDTIGHWGDNIGIFRKK